MSALQVMKKIEKCVHVTKLRVLARRRFPAKCPREQRRQAKTQGAEEGKKRGKDGETENNQSGVESVVY